MMTDEIDVSKELTEAQARHAIALPDQEMPLDITVRSIALTVAQRHCGDITVKEGNLYQQLKMDNKLGGPLTVETVLRAALIFEMYLWGKWSQDLAGKALTHVLDELDQAVKGGAFDKHIEELKDEPPTRPQAGGDE